MTLGIHSSPHSIQNTIPNEYNATLRINHKYLNYLVYLLVTVWAREYTIQGGIESKLVLWFFYVS